MRNYCDIIHTKNKLMENKKMWKAPLVAQNAPKDKDTEMYAYILLCKLFNK